MARPVRGTRAFFAALLGVAGLVSCTATTPDAVDPPKGGTADPAVNPDRTECRDAQDACVARCKESAPDQASRQACFTECMRKAKCG
jgi:hypothetical protein